MAYTQRDFNYDVMNASKNKGKNVYDWSVFGYYIYKSTTCMFSRLVGGLNSLLYVTQHAPL